MKHAIVKPVFINLGSMVALFKVKCGFVSVLVTDYNTIRIPTDADQPIGGYSVEDAKLLRNALDKAIKLTEDISNGS